MTRRRRTRNQLTLSFLHVSLLFAALLDSPQPSSAFWPIPPPLPPPPAPAPFLPYALAPAPWPLWPWPNPPSYAAWPSAAPAPTAPTAPTAGTADPAQASKRARAISLLSSYESGLSSLIDRRRSSFVRKLADLRDRAIDEIKSRRLAGRLDELEHELDTVAARLEGSGDADSRSGSLSRSKEDKRRRRQGFAQVADEAFELALAGDEQPGGGLFASWNWNWGKGGGGVGWERVRTRVKEVERELDRAEKSLLEGARRLERDARAFGERHDARERAAVAEVKKEVDAYVSKAQGDLDWNMSRDVDGVGYDDWQRYHALKDRADAFISEVVSLQQDQYLPSLGTIDTLRRRFSSFSNLLSSSASLSVTPDVQASVNALREDAEHFGRVIVPRRSEEVRERGKRAVELSWKEGAAERLRRLEVAQEAAAQAREEEGEGAHEAEEIMAEEKRSTREERIRAEEAAAEEEKWRRRREYEEEEEERERRAVERLRETLEREWARADDGAEEGYRRRWRDETADEVDALERARGREREKEWVREWEAEKDKEREKEEEVERRRDRAWRRRTETVTSTVWDTAEPSPRPRPTEDGTQSDEHEETPITSTATATATVTVTVTRTEPPTITAEEEEHVTTTRLRDEL